MNWENAVKSDRLIFFIKRHNYVFKSKVLPVVRM